MGTPENEKKTQEIIHDEKFLKNFSSSPLQILKITYGTLVVHSLFTVKPIASKSFVTGTFEPALGICTGGIGMTGVEDEIGTLGMPPAS